jgi:PAS domain S-box-containing protein
MTRRTILTDFAKAVVLATVYFAAGKFGLQLAFIHQSASAVWPPTGIALAAILLGGYRLWPGIWLGAFLVNLTTAGTVLTSIGIATGNALEAIIGAWLVERFANGRRAFERAADIFLFVLLAGILSTSLSATIGVTSLALGGVAPFDNYFPIWITWWLGDAVSALLITPLIVVWSTTPIPRLSREKASEAGLVLAGIWLVSILGFGGALSAEASQYSRFLIYPVVLWASYHFGRRGAVSTVLLVTVVAIWGTMHGFGPFVSSNRNQSLLLLQTFTITLLVTNLVLGAVVSERSRAEKALEFASRFPEENPDPVMRLDHGEIVSYLNPSAQRLHAGWGLALAKKAPAAIADIGRAVLATATKRSVELPFGKQMYMASFAPIVEAGYVNVYFSDIAERKRAEEALRESEDRFRTMAESAPVMIWMSGLDKLCTFFNRPRLEFTGRTMKQELGNGWADGVHPEDRTRCLETYGSAFDARREFQMEYRLRRHDGEYRWLLDHGVPRFASASRFIGYIGSCMDITERKLAEAELESWRCELESRVEKRTAELALAHSQLQAEVEERKRLEGEIARAVEREQLRLGQELHDGLGQQLTGIGYMMTALQMKLRKLSPTRAREAGRLQCLLQQSIEQTRVLAKGFYPVELERHGLLVALQEITSKNDPHSEISYSVQSDGNPIAATLKGPLAIQLFRIAQEAVHNATKHARAGNVLIRLAKANGDITLTVQDNGSGFPPNMDSSKGMGVRIMRHRARMIGGKLDFRNDPSGGGVVTCSVPFGECLALQMPIQCAATDMAKSA